MIQFKHKTILYRFTHEEISQELLIKFQDRQYYFGILFFSSWNKEKKSNAEPWFHGGEIKLVGESVEEIYLKAVIELNNRYGVGNWQNASGPVEL